VVRQLNDLVWDCHKLAAGADEDWTLALHPPGQGAHYTGEQRLVLLLELLILPF